MFGGGLSFIHFSDGILKVVVDDFFLNFVIHEMEFEILLCSLLYHSSSNESTRYQQERIPWETDKNREIHSSVWISVTHSQNEIETQFYIHRNVHIRCLLFQIFCYQIFRHRNYIFHFTISHILYMRKQKHGISSHMQPIKFRWKLNFLRIKFSKFFLQFSPNFHATRGGILRSFETSKENIFQHTTLRTHSLNFLMLFFTSKQLLRISNSQN